MESPGPAEVVLNSCYGGFGLSDAALKLFRELANLPPDTVDVYDSSIERHDPALVETVRRLGAAADGPFAQLRIVTLTYGRRYRVNDYDGMEDAEEPEDLCWNDVDDAVSLAAARRAAAETEPRRARRRASAAT